MVSDIGITAGIDYPFGEDRLSAGFAFSDNAFDDIALHHGADGETVQNGNDFGLLYHFIRHILEHVGVQALGKGLRVFMRAAHIFGPVFKLDPDAAGLHRLFMPVPGVTEMYILMALSISFSNIWGLFLKEWKGVSRKTVVVLIIGIIILILSTFVINFT